MARLLNKDPLEYQREADSFLADLKGFHAGRGTAFHRVPRISGKSIDLYLLYVLVTTRGGWEKVNELDEWDILTPLFDVPTACVNAGLALKQIYLRYLDHYEKVHFHGEEYDSRHDDGSIIHDTSSRLSKRHYVRAYNAVPMTYNTGQHVVSDLLRRSFGLAALRTPCEYEHLLLSLLSPLPNEQDFALNVCTLLSGETSAPTTAGRAQRPSLRLSAHPRLLEAILAHAGIYTDEQTRHYLMTSCLRTRHYNPLHFWRSSVSERRLLRLLSVRYAPERRPRRSDQGDEPEEEWSGGLTAADDDQLLFSSRRAAASCRCLPEDEDSASVRLEEEEVAALLGREAVDDVDDGVFAPGTELGRQERAGQRVLQVVELIRNLSFDAANAVQLANSCACLRLLLLAAHSRWGQLASSARDALGNVCGDLSLRRPASRRLSGRLLELAGRQLLGADRSGVLAALEMLNRLARGADDNDEPLTELLVAEPLLQRVAAFLTLHDILLLVAALECMLALTALGETPCRLVARHSGAVDTLISLVSVEAQSYGPRACILMKVMQTPCTAPVTVASPSAAAVCTPAAAVSAFPSASAVAVVGGGPSVATPVAVLPIATPQRVFRPAAAVKSPLLPHSSGLVTAAVHQSAAATSLQQPPRQTVVASVPSLPPTTVVIGRPVTPVAKLTAPPAVVQTPAPAVSSQSVAANNAAARQIPMPLIQQQQVASLPKLSSQGASLVPTENNLWVVKWLQTVCEVCPSNCVEQTALYKQYTASAMVQQWKGVITQGEFANCVKSVFGSSVTAVGRRAPGSGTSANAPMEYYFDGIRSRLQIVTTTVMPQQQSAAAGKQLQTTQQLQHSSILKAQLSAPPRSNVAEPTASTQPLQSPLSSGSSHLSQALLGATTPPPLRPISRTTAVVAVSAATASSGSSSLIKSLLASKVAPLVPTHRTGQLNQQLQQPPPTTAALSPSCFSVPQVARNIQNKRVAVNGVSQPSADTTPPATNATAAGVVVTAAGVQQTVGAAPLQNGVRDGSPCASPVPSPRAVTPLCLGGGEGLLADLLERKVAPVNGIDRELRIGERGLELVNNNKGSGGVKAEPAADDVWPGGPQQPTSNNGGGSTSPAKNGGTDLLASALDMAGLMDDLGVLDGEEELVAPSPPPPPPPKPPQQQLQGRKRPADTAAGGDVKRQTAGTPVLTTTTGHQQVVMVPQSVANMMLKLPVSVASGQQLVLPHGQQLIMTSSGQLVVGQQHAQVLVQQGGNTATTNVVVGQPTVGQPQAVLLAQQHSSSARTLIFLPPQQRMLLSQAAAGSCVVSQPGQVLVQVSRGGGTPQVVASTLVTSVASTASSQPRAAAVVHNSSVRPANTAAVVTAPSSFTVQTQTSRSSSPVTPLQAPAPAASQPAAPVASARPLPAGLLCEWRGCLRGFPTAHAVYQHAIHAHCPPEFTDIPCLWERCDGMVRKRYSMMTHLQDRHCGDSMLRLMRRRREQLQQTGRTDIPAPAPPPPHPGYANNAAMQAIRRHALAVAAADAKSPAATDAAEKEGPVTKSIRLTAALVLRNLAVYSSQGRRLLRAREPFLLSVAASSAESSRTVCQILADLQQPDDDETECGQALTS